MRLLLVCLISAFAGSVPTSPPDAARDVVTRAIAAVGGEGALKNLVALDIESIGHEYYIDQSERPEGPFIVEYVSASEQRDVAGGRSRVAEQRRSIQSPDWSGAGLA